MSIDLKKDAENAVLDFWDYAKYWKVVDFKSENAVNEIMELPEWKSFWNNYLRNVLDGEDEKVTKEYLDLWNEYKISIVIPRLKRLVGEYNNGSAGSI